MLFCLKFLFLSLSTAVAVRSDLKTGKKGGLTRDLYITGFPCQICLCVCQKSNHDKLIWEWETQEYGICDWDIKEEHLRNSALIYPLPCDISAWEQ